MKIVKLKRIILVISMLIICMAAGMLAYRKYNLDTRTIDSKIDIGGCRLKVNCCGKGKPTVIFESGLGNDSGTWANVQPEISKITRTFSYDRAGLGESDPVKNNKGSSLRTSLDQVHDLHKLLEKAEVKPPYIIAAHSIGGYNARLFAAEYPKEVSGIVFIDSSHENQFDGLSEKDKEKQKKAFAGVELNFDGIIQSTKQVKESRKKDALRNIPIIVLTADNFLPDSENTSWISFQNDIASLSDKSKHIIVRNSTHFIQFDHPETVINAIKELIGTARK